MPTLPLKISPNAGERVVNGTSVGKPLPYQLQVRSKQEDSHHCGAVLISSRFVLSADHCFNTKNEKSDYASELFEYYELVAGEYYRNNLGE